MEEYVDIYNQQRQPTGRTIAREKAFLAEGEYLYYVLGIVRDAQGRFLITQRSPEKRWAPGSWEVTGGGVLAGETPDEAIVREVREEVGLDVSDILVAPFYSYESVDLARGDNYFVDMYLFQMDIERSDIKLQDSEAVDCCFATWDEISKLAQQGKFLHFERLTTALEHIV